MGEFGLLGEQGQAEVENLDVSVGGDHKIAGQGATEDEALDNLKEAPALHFDPPQATRPPKVRVIEVEVGAA